MDFIIHASGSLGNRPDPKKQAYRLRCRFRVPAAPPRWHYLWPLWRRELEQAKYKAAEWFIADMKAEGWHYVDKFGFTMKGPFIPVDPEDLPATPRKLTAHQMLLGVSQGNPFRDEGNDTAHLVLPLSQQEDWEFELVAVFVHATVLVEYPTEREKQEDLRR